MTEIPDSNKRTLLDYLFFRSPEEILPEQAQSLTRIAFAFIAILLLVGYDAAFGPVSHVERLAMLVAFSYLLISIVHYIAIRRFPRTQPWRIYSMIILDHAIVSMATYAFGTAGAVFYPFYFWVTVGNGLRYGVGYLHGAAAISIVLFLIATRMSSEWQQQPQLIFGLATGMVLMPAFFLSLLRQLGRTNAELRQEILEKEHIATHDSITGLPNRVLLEDRLDYAIANTARLGREIAVFHIDIDSFKTVNDTYGHAFGDELLIQVARRLRDCQRSFDTLARIGGDEFVVFLQGNHQMTQAASFADRMAEYASGHYHHKGVDVFLSISIGVAQYPNDGMDTATLLRNAETAMYRAKREGGSRYCFYDTNMSREVTEQLTIQVELRKALNANQFRLFFQPRIDAKTCRIIGAEALVRWQHPTRGLLEPEAFIHAAEESDMILSLDRWLLDAVCREVSDWQNKGLPFLLVSVNVSGRQFMESDYIETLRKIIEVTHIDQTQLALEITEGTLIEHSEQVDTQFHEIKKLGLKLMLDDFGTRYSSLNYLKRFPVDTLKIDRSFIKDIPGSEDDCALVETMINIAHRLRMDVCAEGVETTQQLRWLRDKQCDTIQGFLASRPVAAEAFRHMIAHRETEKLVSS